MHIRKYITLCYILLCTVYMNKHYFTYYIYCKYLRVKACWELNLVRALAENTRLTYVLYVAYFLKLTVFWEVTAHENLCFLWVQYLVHEEKA